MMFFADLGGGLNLKIHMDAKIQTAKEILNTMQITIPDFKFLQSHSNKNSMILAQKQTHRATE